MTCRLIQNVDLKKFAFFVSFHSVKQVFSEFRINTGGCDGKTLNGKHLYPIFQVYGWKKSSWTYDFKKKFLFWRKIEDLPRRCAKTCTFLQHPCAGLSVTASCTRTLFQLQGAVRWYSPFFQVYPGVGAKDH